MADQTGQNAGTDPAGTGDTQNQSTNEGQATGTPAQQGAEGQQDGQQEGQQGTSKTYTEAEVNAMVADRLAKHERSLRKQFQADLERHAERAQMDEAERIKAEKADLEQRLAETEQRYESERRRAQLVGKVADPTAALKLLDPDDHLTKDGDVNVDALLTAYPFLAPQAPQPEPRTGPTPTTAGGGTGATLDMNSVIRQRAGR